MSESASEEILHPVNPTLSKDINTPKERGQTRVLADGSLVYREPITDIEMPAVRLEDIRPRLVKEASKKKSYRFPKKRGFEDTNVTAFLKKDYNYGPERENWPDRLFQIQSNGSKGEKPEGYVMDDGYIVLDGFDHGLRNFDNQLPIYVSSELEGHDIEDYLRRNREISVYDLVARAPNGYFKGPPETKNKKSKKGKKDADDEKQREWHEGSPRVGTFSMRATRFRLGAGCLSWEKKDGTVAKNQRILDVIPAQYKDPLVNSTRGWRNLSKAEIKKVQSGAMSKPQQGPKARRAAHVNQAHTDRAGLIKDSVQEKVSAGAGEGNLFDVEDAGIGYPKEQGSEAWPDYNPEDYELPVPAPLLPPTYHNDYSINKFWPAATVGHESPTHARNQPSISGGLGSRKRSGDFDEKGNSRAPKRTKVAPSAQIQKPIGEEKSPQATTSRAAQRKQQRPTSRPYVAGASSPSFTSPAIDSVVPGQGSYSMVPGPRQLQSSREVTGKRKRTSHDTVEQAQMLHSKRPRTHTATPATAPMAQGFTNPVSVECMPSPTPGLDNSIWGSWQPTAIPAAAPVAQGPNQGFTNPVPVPATGLNTYTWGPWQPHTQDTGFSQTGHQPDFSQYLLPTAYEEQWTTPSTPANQEETMPAFTNQQGMFDPFATVASENNNAYLQAPAPAPTYMPQYTQNDLESGAFNQPTAGFYPTSQWDSLQSTDWNGLEPGWTV